MRLSLPVARDSEVLILIAHQVGKEPKTEIWVGMNRSTLAGLIMHAALVVLFVSSRNLRKVEDASEKIAEVASRSERDAIAYFRLLRAEELQPILSFFPDLLMTFVNSRSEELKDERLSDRIGYEGRSPLIYPGGESEIDYNLMARALSAYEDWLVGKYYFGKGWDFREAQRSGHHSSAATGGQDFTTTINYLVAELDTPQ